jgi:putative ABC transport system permease protein
MPDWDAAIRSRLKTVHLDGAREAEIVEELAEHLDDRFRELLASGLDERRVQELVLEELDSHELIAARRRRTPAAPPVGVAGGKNFMESIWHDLRVSVRMIRMKPAFGAAVVGMLALGVAGNAAIFSIFNGLFLRPLPFTQSERLVDIDETAPKWNLDYTGVAIQDFMQWQKDNTTFDGMAFFTAGGANMITPDGVAQRVKSAQVTYNLLDVLGLKPVAGRDFLPEEDRPNGPRVVMLGYDLWKRLFNGDTAAIGKTLKFDDTPYTIVGILPREAVIPDAEAWSPLRPDPTGGSGWFLSGIGRLKRDVTIWQAANDLTRVHRALIATGRNVNEITTPVVAYLRDRYFGDLKRVTRMLLGAVGVVLLIACVNIAGLMLVRGESRSREIAIRTAVGASRGRVIRQLLTESLVLAAAGGVLGIALGKVFLTGLLVVIADNVPQWIRFDLDWRFTLFCIAATGAAALVFGLAPALQAASVESAGCLQSATRSTLTRGKRGVLSVLVTGEIALALILLISSGLLIQAFRKVLAMDPGFRPQGVLTFSLRTPGTRYAKPEQRLAFFNDAIARLKSVARSLLGLGRLHHSTERAQRKLLPSGERPNDRRRRPGAGDAFDYSHAGILRHHGHDASERPRV